MGKSIEMESQQKEARRAQGEEMYDELLAILGDSAAEQEKVLARILSANAETEYLRMYELNGATDAKTFKEKVPVSDYENYKPFVDRMFHGDKSPMLTAYPVTQLWTSSGTTGGTPRMFPGTDEELTHRAVISNYSGSISSRLLPEVMKWKSVPLFTVRKSTFSPGGLPYHPVSTGLFTSPAFMKNYKSKTATTTPPEVLMHMTQDNDAILYCHLLFGLVQREEVGMLVAFFPTGALRAMRSLEQWWPQMCEDIANGSLSSNHVKEESLRSALQPRLQKFPDLAEHLRKEFSASDSQSWNGIMRRLWPNLVFVDASSSGTMEPYYHRLTEYAGDVPVTSMNMYVSTEGNHGVNLDPKCPSVEARYNLFPRFVYYEFIEVGDNGPNPKVWDLVNLSEGKEYEILITTFSGLCRYRMGDVLKVAGHYKSSPMFRLVRRSSVVLSVDTDKTDEAELNAAVEQGSQLLRRKLGWKLVDFTSMTDYKTEPGHYVIFWELDPASTESLEKNSSPMQQQVLEECCAAMEAALGRIYRRGRQENVVGALELRLLRKGTFDLLCANAVSRGASASQFKTPRGLTPKSPHLQTILDNVIHSAVSKSKPSF